ncbi:hypothetical protein ACQ4PT_058996 [Festuca glaucescens]
MGTLCSSSDDAIRATKNHTQDTRLDAVDGADWSSLPEDLLLIIMAALDIPGLFRSGAVCASWHDAYSTFRRLRRPSPKQGPCLLYACDEYGPNHAAMYCPNTDTTFRVPFRHHGRGLFFSSNGWVFATDEAADPYLLNPVTGVQATLPSVKTLPGIDTCKVNFLNDDGTLSASASEDYNEWARDSAYCRVAISTGHDAAATCTVFEPSPAVTRIMCGVTTWGNPTKYLTITPSGELWQVWRMWTEAGLKHRWTYQDVLRYTSKECIDFTGKDDDEKLEAGGVEKHRHALFLGSNTAVCIPTMEFPAFESNRAYLSDDCSMYGPRIRRDLGFDVDGTSVDGRFEGLDTLAAHIGNLLSQEPSDVKLGTGCISMGTNSAWRLAPLLKGPQGQDGELTHGSKRAVSLPILLFHGRERMNIEQGFVSHDADWGTTLSPKKWRTVCKWLSLRLSVDPCS